MNVLEALRLTLSPNSLNEQIMDDIGELVKGLTCVITTEGNLVNVYHEEVDEENQLVSGRGLKAFINDEEYTLVIFKRWVEDEEGGIERIFDIGVIGNGWIDSITLVEECTPTSTKALQELVEMNGIDISLWKVKGIDNLYEDIISGERRLMCSIGYNLSLDMSCVSCEIYYMGKRLIETSVVSPNGTLHRNFPCTGKIKMDEDPLQGMQRELGEELNFHNLPLTFFGTFEEERIQSYYAGIPGKVIHHKYYTHLPDELYEDSYSLVEEDRTFTFEWVDIE